MTFCSSSVLSVSPSLPGVDLSPEIIPQDGTNRLGGYVSHSLHSDGSARYSGPGAFIF